MPSRTSSNASDRPRRSKSFSSTRPHQLRHAKSFNTSQITHHEALAAADIAFQRARERDAIVNNCDSGGAVPATHPTRPMENSQLANRHSVRFTGSNAIKTRELPHTRRVVSNSQYVLDERRSDRRPEYVETSISSEPSSYRKLRKAKSMFTPGKPPSLVSVDGTPTSKSQFKYDSMRSSRSHNDPPTLPDRRLRRSFSFLRGVTDRLSTADRHNATNDAAIELAQNQYLRQLEAQRIKEQPGSLNFVGKRKSQKEFRRTVRTSSTNSYDTATKFSSWPVEPAKVNSIGRKARSVSQTLKLALRKVFRRPLPSPLKLPEQHLSATRAHYGGRLDEDYHERYFSPIPSPDVEILRRVDSRESVIRNSMGYNEIKVSNESVLSVTIEGESSNQQSRVTSWTDSTKANTIHLPQFVDRKRLSIIKEDGRPHQCSSSAGLFMDSMNGYAAFRQPVRLDTAGPVAAQRVYSALQREIRKSEPTVAQDESNLNNDSELRQLHSIPSVRGVLSSFSDDHIAMDGRPAADRQTHSIPASESFLLRSSPTFNSDDTTFRPVQSDYDPMNYDFEYVEAMDGLTPQQIAHLNEPDIPATKKPLRKSKSAFFPSELQITKLAISPKRQSTFENNDFIIDVKGDEHHEESNSWAPISPLPPHSPLPKRNNGAEISESVYSSTEGGHTPRVLGSSTSLPKSDSSPEIGAAVIITGGLRSSQSSLPINTQRLPISDESSGEWKKHMTTEKLHIDNHSSEYEAICNALPVSRSGHKRENAEWDTEGITISHSYKPMASSAQSSGKSHGGVHARPALQERMMSRSNIDRYAQQDAKTTRTEENSALKENSPKRRFQKLPNKSVMVETVHNSLIPVTATFDGHRSAASRLSQSPQSERKNSPGTVTSRNSPERAERLRRLRNRSSQSLTKSSTPPKNGSENTGHEITQDPSVGNGHTPNLLELPFSRLSSQGASSNALVGAFLKSRRSQMRISDDSANDPAFL